MGFLDKAKQAVSGNKRQVKQGIDKAADIADDKAGAHADKVHKGARMAKQQVDKLDDGDADTTSSSDSESPSDDSAR